MNKTANPSALRVKGYLLRQTKKYRPLQKLIEQQPMLRTMDQLYDCFYEYSRGLMFAKPANPLVPLEKRAGSTSDLQVILPLGTDASSRLKMADSTGNVRLGRLLESIDIVAPCCCYMLNREDPSTKWFENGTLPRMLVTSRIHPVSLTNAYRISPYHDIFLNGKVTWTSEYQSEATVSVKQNGCTMLTAKLLFASLNATNIKEKCPVNQLKPTTSYETELFHRRTIANTTKPPAPQLTAMEKPIVKDGEIAMSATALTTTTIAYPEHENPYGSVFGGYLVRQGIESAEMCAKLFAKADVTAVSLDNAEFLKVIEIGSILRFNAYICNVKNNYVNVCSQAEVFNERTQQFEFCDRFLFTFETNNNNKLPRVVPHNMQEFVAQWRSQNIAKAN
ncbi:unnamed protein product [Caenorhabditis bovis]|uniref:HotDog ACOT-type domain-containing protein n=1 Tax=Caenorhabditis bovis TaxID=2654633 RepID=A0A8S1FC31_9PELO|nr:unnamed protein product [Caenorhabditis bovis]